MTNCWLLLLCLAFLLPAGSAACHPDDLQALRALAGNLRGGNAAHLRTVWSGASCCAWEGVGCDGASGRVTVLRLPGHGLLGSIPGASLAGLTRLEKLFLGSNSFAGAFRGCKGLLITVGNSSDIAFTNMPLYVERNRRILGQQPNVISGSGNSIRSGSNNVVSGNDNTVLSGNDNVVTGSNNVVSGSGNVVTERNHVVSGSDNVVSGRKNVVTGSNNVVSGSNHVVSGNNKVVTGG